ncbi:MAG: AAA family ATPase [Nitrospirota bacterium]
MIKRLVENVERSIRGKPEAVRLAVVALIGRGHLLIEDVPGMGKTTLAHSLARSINCSFHRVQFTSDLMPSDILGVTVYDQRRAEFVFKKGPVFANIVLADEINRTTPKTQSALLEAMNEGQVTVEKETYTLPRPFMVVATQNPLEFHGTFPLPESQLDRFLLRMKLGYPSLSSEKEILRDRLHGTGAGLPTASAVLSGDEVLALQDEADRVRMDESLLDYILAIVEATRRSDRLSLGVSPRGTLFLQKAARAMAITEGRDYCIPDDIKKMAVPVLSHRVILNTRGGYRRSGDDAEEIIREILEAVEVPI